jgi:hypothetical protein
LAVTRALVTAVLNRPLLSRGWSRFFAARGICRLLEEDEREREALLPGLSVLAGARR